MCLMFSPGPELNIDRPMPGEDVAFPFSPQAPLRQGWGIINPSASSPRELPPRLSSSSVCLPARLPVQNILSSCSFPFLPIHARTSKTHTHARVKKTKNNQSPAYLNPSMCQLKE